VPKGPDQRMRGVIEGNSAAIPFKEPETFGQSEILRSLHQRMRALAHGRLLGVPND
jgi:hypothetical protein